MQSTSKANPCAAPDREQATSFLSIQEARQDLALVVARLSGLADRIEFGMSEKAGPEQPDKPQEYFHRDESLNQFLCNETDKVNQLSAAINNNIERIFNLLRL